MSTKLELGGFYTYTSWSSLSDDGIMPRFKATIDEKTGIITGSGKDSPGTFAIAGVLTGDEVRFIKQYTNSNGNAAWKYIGQRLEPKGNVYQFAGGWGSVSSNSSQYGTWVLSGVAPESARPHHPIEGQWAGNYLYANDVAQQDGPMHITISLDDDDSVSYSENGPFAITGTGTDSIGSFTLKGSLSSGNDLDVTKTYNVNGDSWSWRYQGLYDPAGAIGGIWRETNNEEASPSGSFQLAQKRDIPRTTAQAIAPNARNITNASSTSTIQNAVKALESKSGQVPAAALQALLTGFNGLK